MSSNYWYFGTMKFCRKTRLKAHELFDPSLSMQLTHREHGADIFRVIIKNEIIWEWPGDYFLRNPGERWERTGYAWKFVSDAMRVVEEFKDRPATQKCEPLTRKFHGLEEILVAADKRIGRKDLIPMLFTCDNQAARHILGQRIE